MKKYKVSLLKTNTELNFISLNKKDYEKYQICYKELKEDIKEITFKRMKEFPYNCLETSHQVVNQFHIFYNELVEQSGLNDPEQKVIVIQIFIDLANEYIRNVLFKEWYIMTKYKLI